MHVHSNAVLNKKQRLRVRQSTRTRRALAQELSVSTATVQRWRHRDSPEDRGCRPQGPAYAFGQAEEALILSLRRRGLPLDGLVDALRVPLPGAKRATVHRVLVRHGVSRLSPGPGGGQEVSAEAKRGTFKEYGPGFVHMDGFYLPKLDGTRRYCFVAIDRATRLAYLAVYENRDAAAAAGFFKRCLAFFPFKISKLLTDNGREFTLKGFRNRWGNRVSTKHALCALCEAWGIEHRTTRPYTPKTNGLVERMNGLTKGATVKARRCQTAQEMRDDLCRWSVQYNFCRPHRRIGSRTPYEACLAWFAKPPGIFIREPAALLAYRSQSTGT